MFGICRDAFGRFVEPIEATGTSSKIRGDDGMSLGWMFGKGFFGGKVGVTTSYKWGEITPISRVTLTQLLYGHL